MKIWKYEIDPEHMFWAMLAALFIASLVFGDSKGGCGCHIRIKSEPSAQKAESQKD